MAESNKKITDICEQLALLTDHNPPYSDELKAEGWYPATEWAKQRKVGTSAATKWLAGLCGEGLVERKRVTAGKRSSWMYVYRVIS